MRLLIANANTSEFVTAKVVEGARLAARPGTELQPVTGRFGARVIETRAELAVAEHATLELLAEHAPGCDAAVLAVSYDCALAAAREMLPIPVVGITEAALLTACMLGGRLGMIVFGGRMLSVYQELAHRYGVAARVAGWRVIDSHAPYAAGSQDGVDALLVAAVADLVACEGCEAVVLAGAVMAGVPARLQSRCAVPLVDGVTCAVRQAQLLVDLGAPKAHSGSLGALPPREVAGVGEPLVRLLRAGYDPTPVPDPTTNPSVRT